VPPAAVMAVVAGLAVIGLIYASATLALPIWMPVAAGVVGLCVVLGLFLSAYRIASLSIFVLIVFNLATYSFLQGVEGGSTAAYLRLPLLLGALAMVMRQSAARFDRLLSRHWDVLLMGAAATVAGAFGLNPRAGLLYGLWLTLSLVLIVLYLDLVAQTMEPHARVRAVARLLGASHVPVVLLAVFALPSYVPGTRLIALFSESNFHAYAAPVVLASLLLLTQRTGPETPKERRQRRYANFVAAWLVPLSVIVTVLSGKRSGLLAIAGLLLLYATLLAPRARTPLHRFAHTLVAVAGLGIFISYASGSDIVQSRIQRARQNSAYFGDAARYQIYQANFQLWLSRPLVGVGLTNAGDAVTIEKNNEQTNFAPHNTYLGLLSETGAIGALSFLILCFRSLGAWRRIPDRRVRRSLVFLAVAPLLISFTEYNLTPGQALFWPLWLCILLPRMYPERVPAAARSAMRGGARRPPVRLRPEPAAP